MLLTGAFATPADAAALAPALRLGREILEERGVRFSDSALQVINDFETCLRVIERRSAGRVDAEVDGTSPQGLTTSTMESGSYVSLTDAAQLVGKSRQALWKRCAGGSLTSSHQDEASRWWIDIDELRRVYGEPAA